MFYICSTVFSISLLNSYENNLYTHMNLITRITFFLLFALLTNTIFQTAAMIEKMYDGHSNL